MLNENEKLVVKWIKYGVIPFVTIFGFTGYVSASQSHKTKLEQQVATNKKAMEVLDLMLKERRNPNKPLEAFSKNSKDCMVRSLYYEATNIEDMMKRDMVMIASSIKNREDDRKMSTCEVVFQKTKSGKFEYSYLEDQYKRTVSLKNIKNVNALKLKTAEEIATKMLEGSMKPVKYVMWYENPFITGEAWMSKNQAVLFSSISADKKEGHNYYVNRKDLKKAQQELFGNFLEKHLVPQPKPAGV